VEFVTSVNFLSCYNVFDLLKVVTANFDSILYSDTVPTLRAKLFSPIG